MRSYKLRNNGQEQGINGFLHELKRYTREFNNKNLNKLELYEAHKRTWEKIKYSYGSAEEFFGNCSLRYLSGFVNHFSKSYPIPRGKELEFWRDLKRNKEIISNEIVSSKAIGFILSSSLIVNGISKLRDISEYEIIFDSINGKIMQIRHLSKAAPQSISLLANAFSKLKNINKYEGLFEKINQHIKNLEDYDTQAISSLANAFSKLKNINKYKKLFEKINQHIISYKNLEDYDTQAISNLANAFSKLGNINKYERLFEKINQHIKNLENLKGYNSQNISNLANAFSKLKNIDKYERLFEKINQHIKNLENLKGYEPQEISNLANAFSKLKNIDKYEGLFKKINQHIKNLEGYEAQHISNLANAFSKLKNIDKYEGLFKKINQHIKNLEGYEAQHISLLANAFSKLGNIDKYERLFEKINQHIEGLKGYNPQAISSLANAFSKLENINKYESVFKKINHHINCPHGLKGYNPQEISNLANAFSKLKNINKYKKLFEKINQHIKNLEDYDTQAISNLANAFSKLDSIDEYENLFEKINAAIKGLEGLNPQGLSILANAFSKLGNIDDYEGLFDKINGHIISYKNLEGYDTQAISLLANAFSKLENINEYKSLFKKINEHIIRFSTLDDINPQDTSVLANAFSKLGNIDDYESLFKKIHERIISSKNLEGYDTQDMSLLANAFSKLENVDEYEGLFEEINKHIISSKNLEGYEAQHISNIANAFSKLGNIDNYEGLFKKINEHIIRFSTLDDINSQDISVLANAFSKLENIDNYGGLFEKINEHIISSKNLEGYDTQAISLLANAFSKLGNIDDYESLFDKIHGHIISSKNLEGYEEQHMSLLANAFSKLGNISEYKALFKKINIKLTDLKGLEAPQSIVMLATAFSKLGNMKEHKNVFERVSSYISENINEGVFTYEISRSATALAKYPNANTEFKETFASLRSYFLENAQTLPLNKIAHSLYGIRKYSKFNEYKELYTACMDNVIDTLSSEDAKEQLKADISEESYGLVIYLLFSSYQEIAPFLKKNFKEKLEQVRGILSDEFKKILGKISISNKYSIKLDKVIKFEGYEPDEAIDKAIEDYLSKINTLNEKEKPHEFNLDEVLNSFNHKPSPPSGGKGSHELPIVTIGGKCLGHEQKDYSIFSRVTDGAIPYIKVKLPGKVTPFTLSTIIPFEGSKYRLDMFGGSAMKGSYKEKDSGSLIALPIADSFPGSDFSKQIQSNFFTFQESFYYFQRSMVPDVSRHDILEGKFKVTIFPDVPSDKTHPFVISASGGQELPLRVHDGCGFIKSSLYSTFLKKDDSLFGKNQGKLPYQALQHYDATEEVISELSEDAIRQLRKEQEPDLDKTYNYLSNGNTRGELGIAIPVTGETVYLPQSKTQRDGKDTDRFNLKDKGILIGRSPYLGPDNLKAVGAYHVEQGKNGLTSTYLSSLTAIQYTLTGKFNLDEENIYTFFKGILVVINDKDWPINYKDTDIAFSAEDQKLSSKWLSSKEKFSEEVSGDFYGILAKKETFSKGSLIAIPTDIQKGLGGDYDGDHNLVLPEYKYPQFTAMIRSMPRTNILSPKPEKTFTPAIANDGYKNSRVKQISGTKLGVLENFTVLMAVYKQQDEDTKKKLGQKCLSELKEYFDHSEESSFYKKFVGEIQSIIPSKANQLEYLLASGIYEGTDAFKRSSSMTELKVMAKIIMQGFTEEGIDISIPYGNSLKRKLAKGYLQDHDSINKDIEKLKACNNLAATLMYKILSEGLLGKKAEIEFKAEKSDTLIEEITSEEDIEQKHDEKLNSCKTEAGGEQSRYSNDEDDSDDASAGEGPSGNASAAYTSSTQQMGTSTSSSDKSQGDSNSGNKGSGGTTDNETPPSKGALLAVVEEIESHGALIHDERLKAQLEHYAKTGVVYKTLAPYVEAAEAAHPSLFIENAIQDGTREEQQGSGVITQELVDKIVGSIAERAGITYDEKLAAQAQHFLSTGNIYDTLHAYLYPQRVIEGMQQREVEEQVHEHNQTNSTTCATCAQETSTLIGGHEAPTYINWASE